MGELDFTWQWRGPGPRAQRPVLVRTATSSGRLRTWSTSRWSYHSFHRGFPVRLLTPTHSSNRPSICVAWEAADRRRPTNRQNITTRRRRFPSQWLLHLRVRRPHLCLPRTAYRPPRQGSSNNLWGQSASRTWIAYSWGERTKWWPPRRFRRRHDTQVRISDYYGVKY